MSTGVPKISRFLVSALAVTMFAAPALAQSGSDNSRITGKVVGGDGEPVAGLKLEFAATAGSAAPGFEVTTNKKGKFTYPNAAPGTFGITVDEGWRISTIGMKQLGATVAAGGEFETDLAPGEGAPPLSWLARSQIRISMTVVPNETAGHSEAELAALKDASPILTELNDMFEVQDWASLIERSAAVLAEDPELGGAHYLRGVALLKTDALDEAVASMRIAAQYMPDQPGIHGTLATILLTQAGALREAGNEEAALQAYGEAADLFERQLQDTPDSVVYLTNRVAALDMSGDTERLHGAIEELLLVDPSNPQVTLRLAELHIEQGRLDEALTLLSGGGVSPAAVGTLIYNAAVEMWNAGDMERTVETVDKGLELAPDMADLYRLKAMALIGSDQPLAIEMLDKYIAMAPADTPGIEADKQLVQMLKDRQ